MSAFILLLVVLAAPMIHAQDAGEVPDLSNQTADAPSQSRFQNAVKVASLSPSVSRLADLQHSPVAFVMDSQGDGYVVLAAGHQDQDHFTRSLTLKVVGDREVYLLVTDAEFNESWTLDFRMDPPVPGVE